MPKCRGKESKVKYTDLNHCRFQYAETKQKEIQRNEVL